MRNIGPKSTAWLAEVDIASTEELQRAGPVFAYLAIKQRHPEVTLNLLWAIYGAIHDIDWREISDRTKKSLRAEIDSHLT